MTRVAAIQMVCTDDAEENRQRAMEKIRQAAAEGAKIILLPELFENLYFCKIQDPAWFDQACSWQEHPGRKEFEHLAKELEVVLPVSFFERDGQSCFNSIAIIDADGSTLGVYRKTHIPQGPGYEEKYYFSPGDCGLKVWKTAYGTIGVGICWDQWFPEAARTMALMGADFLFYPTAIGSEPDDPDLDSSEHWMTVQRGHAGANMIPVITANRSGHETQGSVSLDFYGSSFIAGPRAELTARAGRNSEEILYGDFDPDSLKRDRSAWGIFRDRRPDCYKRMAAL